MPNKRNVLAIDATNLNAGGGVTHIIELLNYATPATYGFEQVIVYGSHKILNRISDKPWLVKKSHPWLNRGFFFRLIYLRILFDRQLRRDGCIILFVPGGAYNGNFRPFVTMCRNMLVFEREERQNVGINKVRLRLKMLEKVQTATFQNAQKVIFLSGYARSYVAGKIRLERSRSEIVHHGISHRFSGVVKVQKEIDQYTVNNPYKILYVSIIDFYKHHLEVIRAVTRLRVEDKYPVELQLVGHYYKPSLSKVLELIKQLNAGEFTSILGVVKYEELDRIYKSTDAFVFASSCENMPNILIEAMHAGLPVACSKSGPMPEFLKDAGVYFDPYKSEEVYLNLKSLIDNPMLRAYNANLAFNYSNEFSWEKCAKETFQVLESVKSDYYKNN